MNVDFKYIFDNVNKWLEFAEKKNAALIALNGVFLFGIYKIDISGYCLTLKIYFVEMSIFLIISTVIALISFIAFVKIPFLFPLKISKKKFNTLFWGDIAYFDVKNYLSNFYDEKQFQELDKFTLDIAEQIVINSKISKRKYFLFNRALWITIAGIITPIFALIIYLVLLKSNRKISSE